MSHMDSVVSARPASTIIAHISGHYLNLLILSHKNKCIECRWSLALTHSLEDRFKFCSLSNKTFKKFQTIPQADPLWH